MQSFKFLSAARFARSLAFLGFTALAAALPAQPDANPPEKPSPPKIEKQIMIFPDSVVREQWLHTLKLVNAPQDLKLLNPGQCIRLGVIATGDDRDSYLENTKLSFRVEFAGKSQEHPLAPLAAIKQIKPEGGDFVNAMLNSINVQSPNMSMASLGASAGNWCVPDNAQDGTATIEAEIESPAGHQKQKSVQIQIESFETGSKRTFKDDGEYEEFTMSYHYQPNPARLFPALQFFAADTKYRSQTGALETAAASLGAALKADPAAAQDFMARVAAQTGFTRAFGLLVLLNGGYDIEPVLKTMSEEDRERFANHPVFPDPFDFSHVEDIGTRLDMLWSIFTSTGQFAPMQKIASALAWRSDWENFDKARKSPNPPKEWTPEIGRAVGYGAAGWALGSFQRTDPLAADYIEFLAASPDTPDGVKAELKVLQTDPAFKWQWGNKK
jgi:hypothetical protein